MRYYMLNKPSGLISAVSDKNSKTVIELFPKELRKGLFTVGRLDKDTRGLLLITDDGDFSFKMTEPKFGIEKQYFFRAFGKISDDDLKKLMEGGNLFGNFKKARPAFLSNIVSSNVEHDIEHIPENERAHAMKNPKGATFSAIITVTEGKRHEVKLLLKSMGCKIFYLERIAMGDFLLDPMLKNGEFRELNSNELELVEKYKKAVF